MRWAQNFARDTFWLISASPGCDEAFSIVANGGAYTVNEDGDAFGSGATLAGPFPTLDGAKVAYLLLRAI